jgi:hypothetical protein
MFRRKDNLEGDDPGMMRTDRRLFAPGLTRFTASVTRYRVAKITKSGKWWGIFPPTGANTPLPA